MTTADLLPPHLGTFQAHTLDQATLGPDRFQQLTLISLMKLGTLSNMKMEILLGKENFTQN